MDKTPILEAVSSYLICCFESGKSTELIDARELYRLLMIQRPFASWFSFKCKQCKLIRHQDYFLAPGKGLKAQKYAKQSNYCLSERAILAIASQEPNHLGLEIQKYLTFLNKSVSTKRP